MITVLIASYNGAERLPSTLAALGRIRRPAGGWKIVLADNGSRDATAAVARSWQTRLPLEYVFRGERGKNAALNRCLPRIAGELVALTDDDVTPEPDWLVELQRSAATRPDYDIFGGQIRPLWPDDRVEPTSDLPRRMLHAAFAVTDPDWSEGATTWDRVWGPNWAVRSRLFRHGHRFDETIGPDGTTRYAMGAETEFVRRMSRLGHLAFHCPTSIVQHRVRAEQLDPAWLLRRARCLGKGMVRVGASHASKRDLCSLLLHEIRSMLEARCRAVRHRIGGDASARLQAAWDLHFADARVLEAVRQLASGQSPGAGAARPLGRLPQPRA